VCSCNSNECDIDLQFNLIVITLLLPPSQSTEVMRQAMVYGQLELVKPLIPTHMLQILLRAAESKTYTYFEIFKLILNTYVQSKLHAGQGDFFCI
jgi:hypothetical protein